MEVAQSVAEVGQALEVGLAERCRDSDGEFEALSGSVILVQTKADLQTSPRPRAPASVLRTSSLTGEGLDRLKEEVVRAAFDAHASLADLEPGLTRERHRVALAQARDAQQSAEAQLTDGRDPVLAAHHLREAARTLEELIGVVDVEEVLDRVFQSFCVGK